MSTETAVSELVLDAWPVLEWLKGREPCRTAFRKIIEDSLAGVAKLSMSRINHGEVVYSIRKSFPAGQVEGALKAFREMPIALYSVDDVLVDEAVTLKSIYPISYADAFAAALAMRRRVLLVTGDPELFPLRSVGLQLYWVGK